MSTRYDLRSDNKKEESELHDEIDRTIQSNLDDLSSDNHSKRSGHSSIQSESVETNFNQDIVDSS